MNNFELLKFLNQTLDSESFKDYCPNGLQVEGKSKIKKIISGVTASLALIEKAIEEQADAILVHHGLFWQGMDGSLTGWLKKRVELLIKNDINLFAYHLPLDYHETLGNNAQLGKKVGFKFNARFGDSNLGMIADVNFENIEDLINLISQTLKRNILFIANNQNKKHKEIKKIAWCTGGAQNFFEEAIKSGVDAYITGEISESQTHLARETDTIFISAGHHATERYGVLALGNFLSEKFNLKHNFIDIDNPA